jgi:hypothetical protein
MLVFGDALRHPRLRLPVCLPHAVSRSLRSRVLARLEPRSWPKTTIPCGLPTTSSIPVYPRVGEGFVSEVLDHNPDASNASYQLLGVGAGPAYHTQRYLLRPVSIQGRK